MLEITKDNYKDIDFNGVIISVPREHLKGELNHDFCLNFECAYYTQGKYGYKERGYHPDKSSFYKIWYGGDDIPNGFGFNSTSRLPWDEEYMYFNNVRYYKFKDMEEFCTWYLQQKGAEIWTCSGELKGKVQEITSTQPLPKTRRIDRLSEVMQYLDKTNKIKELTQEVIRGSSTEELNTAVEDLNNWLEEEV